MTRAKTTKVIRDNVTPEPKAPLPEDRRKALVLRYADGKGSQARVPYTRYILPEWLVRAVDDLALSTDRSSSSVVRDAIEHFLLHPPHGSSS